MGKSDFVNLIKPPGELLNHYDPKRSPTDQPDNDAVFADDRSRVVPESFLDAMIVREEVYVKEQKGPMEKQVDEDDARSFHWVAYASIPAKAVPPITNRHWKRISSHSTKVPIGTIRLVPPPHASRPPASSRAEDGTTGLPEEPYVQLGRLAVTKEFRKSGISRLLIGTALHYAREHPHAIGQQPELPHLEALNKGVGRSFKGLVLVHSQTRLQQVWRKHGFEVDESLGEWDDEGIPHVAMWKRVDVNEARSKSRLWLGTMGPTSP